MENRIIKFRAWDEFGKTMSDPFGVRRGNLIWRSKIETAVTYKGLTDMDVVMQFSGLLDNAKVEIYEDDLFEVIYKDCPEGYSIIGKETTVIKTIGRVVFIFGKFMLEILHPIDKKIFYSDLFSFLKNDEKVVIGNIYEPSHEFIKK